MAELPLNDDEGHAFASHLDGVRVPELMWSESATDTGGDGCTAQLGSSGGGRPLTTTRPAVDDTEQRAHGQAGT